jgi:hypothetical protein
MRGLQFGVPDFDNGDFGGSNAYDLFEIVYNQTGYKEGILS